MILNVSPSRFNALGRESTALAEAITMNNPSKPMICQSGREDPAGSGISSGVDVSNTKVGVGDMCVAVGVIEGIKVLVAVGDGVKVAVEVANSGTTILPESCPHNLFTSHATASTGYSPAGASVSSPKRRSHFTI